jgi:alpha-beta hydrolase superfamily lysophospholipase
VDYPIQEPGDSAGAFSFERALRHVRRAVRCATRTGLPVVAYGDSVGGTLVEHLAVRGSVEAAVAVGAPSDLLTWASGNRVYWRLLGMSRADRRRASPLNRISANPRRCCSCTARPTTSFLSIRAVAWRRRFGPRS